MTSDLPRFSLIAIGVGMAVALGQVLGVPGTAWATSDSWLCIGLLYAGPALCAARAIRCPRETAIWALFAVGTAAYASGYAYWSIFQQGDPNQPYPSLADGFWLSLFPFVLAALILLARSRLRGVNRRVWLDGAIVGLGLASLSASVVFSAVAQSADGRLIAVVTTLAYPVGDLLLLIIVATLFSTARASADRTIQMIAGGVAVLLITDSIWFLQVARGTYLPDGALDLGWPLAVLLIGAAAWQPAETRRTTRVDTSITLPTILISVCVTLLLADHFDGMNTLAVILAGATVAAGVLRLVLTHRAGAELLRVTHRASLTDELTQLGNRAKLLADLDAALEGGRRTLLAFFDLDGFKNYNDTFGHPAGDALLHRLARRLAGAMPVGAEAYRMGGDEFCALIPWIGAADIESTVAPACAALAERGEGFSVTTSWGHVLLPFEATSTSHALSIADGRLYEDKTSGRVSARLQSYEVLKRVIEQRDQMLGIHLDDVAALARQAALDLGLDEDEVERVVLAAELHDVGKSAIPDAILFKTTPLDAEETAFMRRHTIIGERILGGAPSLAAVGQIVRSTHERFDGSGYPDGLAAEDIPLAARIVFVCDAFDAMTSDRPYSRAILPAAAVAELRACAGTQFDPAVVEVLARRIALAPAAA